MKNKGRIDLKRNDEQRKNEERWSSDWTIERRLEEEQEERSDEEQRKNEETIWSIGRLNAR